MCDVNFMRTLYGLTINASWACTYLNDALFAQMYVQRVSEILKLLIMKWYKLPFAYANTKESNVVRLPNTHHSKCAGVTRHFFLRKCKTIWKTYTLTMFFCVWSNPFSKPVTRPIKITELHETSVAWRCSQVSARCIAPIRISDFLFDWAFTSRFGKR